MGAVGPMSVGGQPSQILRNTMYGRVESLCDTIWNKDHRIGPGTDLQDPHTP
jgi:hypothetical protein